jgi:glyoxylase-like metal-dependent hydrolase (beta-lactamase superfamily II)
MPDFFDSLTIWAMDNSRRNIGSRIGLGLAALAVTWVGWPRAAADPTPLARNLRPGVWFIAGGIEPGRQPDGNSVIFDAPDGLIVMDTGRHEWHRQAILAFARARGRKVAAIVNSHWHLDHMSGNPALKAAYPQLRVYASDAIKDALTGFLAASARDAAGYLDDPKVPQSMRADIRADLATVQNGAALMPDVVIKTSSTMMLAGRRLRINLAANAATEGDVWIYDEHSKVAAVGDLVTLPAPFLDTACPDGWQAALEHVASTPFEILIPGHGSPMSRAQFSSYRQEFGSFIACANSNLAKAECAAQWSQAVASLLGQDPREMQRARGMAEYYVDMLRANGGRSKYCQSP